MVRICSKVNQHSEDVSESLLLQEAWCTGLHWCCYKLIGRLEKFHTKAILLVNKSIHQKVIGNNFNIVGL